MGQEAKSGARTDWRLLFQGPGAVFLVVSKLVGLHLPPRRNETSSHPWALCLWKPFSFLDRQARAKKAESTEEEEEVRTVEMIAVTGWKMTWYEQAEAWVEEEEARIVASSACPSPDGLQLGRAGWLEVSF